MIRLLGLFIALLALTACASDIAGPRRAVVPRCLDCHVTTTDSVGVHP